MGLEGAGVGGVPLSGILSMGRPWGQCYYLYEDQGCSLGGEGGGGGGA